MPCRSAEEAKLAVYNQWLNYTLREVAERCIFACLPTENTGIGESCLRSTGETPSAADEPGELFGQHARLLDKSG